MGASQEAERATGHPEPDHAMGLTEEEQEVVYQPHSSKLVRFYSHPWTQILLMSLICFCCPGVS